MDFRQIEAFVSVYRLRSFSRAAKVLYLSQPTVSSHISDLEEELGVKLFDRSSREVLATGAGDAFYQYAVNLLETRESAINSLQQYGRQIAGRLEIATSTIPGQYLLPRPLKGFRTKYPDIQVMIRQGDTKEVIREMEEKKFQIGIVGTRLEGEKLHYEVLCRDELLLITAAENDVAYDSLEGSGTQPVRVDWQDLQCIGKQSKARRKYPVISLEEVLEQPFILREQGSGTRQEFESALKKKGIDPDNTLNIVAEMNSTEAIKYAVREGLGVAVVSSLSVVDFLEWGLLKAFTIEGLDLNRFFYLVTHRNQPLAPSVAAFRDYLLEYYHTSSDGI
ncbi:MAG TPA: LysR family transcriptional regulator [Peptococcaceae bacterium]|nr:LysR family transcriptional regulator [Peptococcaceae bacterium]